MRHLEHEAPSALFAIQLIGWEVSGESARGHAVTGAVEEMKFIGGAPTLVLANGDEIPLTHINAHFKDFTVRAAR